MVAVGRVLTIVLLAIGVASVAQTASAQGEGSSYDPLEILFLGDNGLHEPAQRARLIQPVFAERGIHMTYTDRLDDLKLERLRQFDAVLIYANHTHLSDEQERALMEYVREGGGLVPVHSASAMFGNSEAYIKLIGGAFKSHGTGVFTTERTQPNHPAINGVPEVESWDETYVHHKHNPDKTVLSVRVEDDHEEPWTWVRTPGDGRVFYTAWGHDERTWSNDAFQRLLEQGLRWAVGDSALEMEDGVSTINYQEAEVPLPYYPPGEDWGTTGEPIQKVQEPLNPDRSKQHAALPPGFELKLFASEPDIINPIDMAWDAQGRLWIAETFDYPNDIDLDDGSDRIRILEDTDGDGRADEFTTFAEGLNIPTSLTPANGGVIVAQAPYMLFLKDTDGDKQADVRDTLSTGWGKFDTHAGPSNLRYGFDNKIWGSVGYSGFSGSVGGETLEFGQGFYRFPVDGSELEYLATTGNNTWGLGFSEKGSVFGSTANGNPAVHMGVARRYYQQVANWEAPTLGTIADSDAIYPLVDSSKVLQVDHHGRYTAGSGFEVYTAREFPREYWNHTAFVSEPTGHLLGKFALTPEGASYTATNEWNMLASRDAWTSPIQAKVGPDGMLWVIDWYNPVVQHNPTPEDFETGEGNAYETPVRDRKHGRIYRVVPTDADASYEPLQLDEAGPDRLIQALQNDNMFWRRTAQRLLVERGQTDVLPDLYALVEDESMDEIGNNPGALHAIWTLDGLGALDGSNDEALNVVLDAMHHPVGSVRRAALKVLPRTEEVQAAILDAGLLPDRNAPGEMDYTVPSITLQDADPHVRVAALLALSEMPPSERAGTAIASALMVEENVEDRWVHDALIAAGAQHDTYFLQSALPQRLPDDADSTHRANIGEVVRTVATHYAQESSSEVPGPMADFIDEGDPFLTDAFLRGLLEGRSGKTESSQ